MTTDRRTHTMQIKRACRKEKEHVEKFLNLDKLNLEKYHNAETKTGGEGRSAGGEAGREREGATEGNVLTE